MNDGVARNNATRVGSENVFRKKRNFLVSRIDREKMLTKYFVCGNFREKTIVNLFVASLLQPPHGGPTITACSFIHRTTDYVLYYMYICILYYIAFL